VGHDYDLDDWAWAEDLCTDANKLVRYKDWRIAARRELFKSGILVEVRSATTILNGGAETTFDVIASL
jgi:hypothetical protein